MVTRVLAVLLGALFVAPSIALAQASRAGVVTTLEGHVTAKRVALPGPVPLKFKDDVFLQDTVTTGEKSLARMLLGGKAVVTVRERSILTITEMPGRSTIELDSGKFALAVAREKMRPGEEIMIRTPNAVAGVRGTVVVTEVNRQSAQAGGGAPAVLTNFYVLRGTITAQQLDPGTRQPTGAPLQVGTLQAYSQAGNAAPRVAPVPPEQVRQINSGLQPTGPKGGSDAGQEQVKSQAVQTAVTLIGALTGTQGALAMGPPPPPPPPSASMTPPIAPFTGSESQLAQVATAAAQAGFPKHFSGIVALPGSAATFNSGFNGTFTDAAVRLTDAIVVQTGIDANFIEVLGGGDVKLLGGLLRFVNSALIGGGRILKAEGGKLTLAGPLLVDDGGALLIAQEMVRMSAGATLISTGTEALVQLNGTAVEGTAALSMTNASMFLAGPLASVINLVDATGVSSQLPDAPALFDLDASSITSTGTGALLSFSSSDADPDGQFLRLVNGSTITLAGPLLSASHSTIAPAGSLLAVAHSSFSSSSTSALIDLTSSTLKAARNSSSSVVGRFLSLFSGSSPFGTSTAGASVSLAGPFLSATGSTLSATQAIGIFGGAAFTSTTPNALITLHGSTLKLTTKTQGAVADHGDIVAIGGLGGSDGTQFATMALKGSLLHVGNGSQLDMSGALAHVFGGGKIIEEHPTAAFASITGGTHTIASDAGTALFRLFGRTSATTSEVVSTPGLDTSSSALTLGTDEPLKRSGSGAFLEASGATISAKAVLTVDSALLSASAPILSLKNSATLTSAGDAINLTANAKLAALGPLVKLDAATLSITNGHAIRALNGSFLSVGGDLLSIMNGGQLNVSAGALLFVGGSSVVKINGALVNFNNSSGNIAVTNGVCSGTCSTAGGLNYFLQNGAVSSNISVSGAIKNAGSGTVTQGLSNAVIILDGANSKLIISGN